MDYLGIFSFLLLGFSGGFGHCAGMCNPFVLYIASRFCSKQDSTWYKKLLPHLIYNSGRIATYTSLGLFCGLLGKISADITKLQGIATFAAGIFLIIYGLIGLTGKNILAKLESSYLASAVSKSFLTLQPNNPFFVGIILGFLPCGLVYIALAGSIALDNPAAGGLAMFLFGVGTSTAMMATAFIGNYISSKRGMINKISMFFLIGMGIYFIAGMYLP